MQFIPAFSDHSTAWSKTILLYIKHNAITLVIKNTTHMQKDTKTSNEYKKHETLKRTK